MSTKEITSKDLETRNGRNRVAIELRPLVLKMVNQWADKCLLDRDLIQMKAEDGLLQAMDEWHEGTTQTFSQYAAWCMRYNILNGISELSSTVKVSSYYRSSLMDRGESVHVVVSIESSPNGEGLKLEEKIPDSENPFELFTRESAMERLVSFIDRNFNDKTKEIFYSTYGLKGFKVLKGNELRVKYGCSDARISQIVHSVIDKVRRNRELVEILESVR